MNSTRSHQAATAWGAAQPCRRCRGPGVPLRTRRRASLNHRVVTVHERHRDDDSRGAAEVASWPMTSRGRRRSGRTCSTTARAVVSRPSTVSATAGAGMVTCTTSARVLVVDDARRPSGEARARACCAHGADEGHLERGSHPRVRSVPGVPTRCPPALRVTGDVPCVTLPERQRSGKPSRPMARIGSADVRRGCAGGPRGRPQPAPRARCHPRGAERHQGRRSSGV